MMFQVWARASTCMLSLKASIESQPHCPCSSVGTTALQGRTFDAYRWISGFQGTAGPDVFRLTVFPTRQVNRCMAPFNTGVWPITARKGFLLVWSPLRSDGVKLPFNRCCWRKSFQAAASYGHCPISVCLGRQVPIWALRAMQVEFGVIGLWLKPSFEYQLIFSII